MTQLIKSFLFLIPMCFVCTFVNAQAYQGELLAHWSDSTLVASNAHNNTYNEIWGYARDGKEYAIIGTTKGTHIIDVTDPTNIFEAYVIEGQVQGAQIVHRDYHDFQDYLYVVADEGDASTLQIIDLSTLPLPPTVVYDSDEIINRAHNIFIDKSAQRLYSLSHQANNTSQAYAVWDISDPLNPVELRKSNFLGPLLISHVHDGHIENNLAYLNCGFDGLVIADMTDLDSIQVLSHLETSQYPDSGYNHSGWPNEDGTAYFFVDETHTKDIKSMDVSDKSDIMFLQQFNSESGQFQDIAHNLIVKGDFLYVAYYYDGLQVFNISDPQNIVRIMHYPTSQLSAINKFEGAWGVYPFLPSGNILVSDMQEGLFVINNEQVSNTFDHEIDIYIDVFPNPSTSVLVVKNNSIKEIKSYMIMDAQAKVVGKEQVSIMPMQSLSIESNLNSGIYFLHIMTDSNDQMVKKIVIE